MLDMFLALSIRIMRRKVLSSSSCVDSGMIRHTPTSTTTSTNVYNWRGKRARD